jgi:hypothetical protein
MKRELFCKIFFVYTSDHTLLFENCAFSSFFVLKRFFTTYINNNVSIVHTDKSMVISIALVMDISGNQLMALCVLQFKITGSPHY